LPEDILKFDPNYLENEDKYKSIRAGIPGEHSDAESGSGSDEEEDSEEEEGD
jgi:pre-mRNA-splicing factor CWC22